MFDVGYFWDMKQCSRCKKERNTWEHQWPSYARIEIGISCQMSQHLKIHYNHSLVKDFSQQGVVLEYGNGYKIPESEYGLCVECQNELVELIGNFFNTTK